MPTKMNKNVLSLTEMRLQEYHGDADQIINNLRKLI